VLAAQLFDKPAFRNVIVNGMVNAEDGKKMSKRLRNYTAPDELMEVYGADALRLYYITSGLMRGEEMRFSDAGVRDMVRRALLPWYNAFRFLTTYATIDGWSPATAAPAAENVLDRWILSRLQSLKQRIEVEMAGYRLYNVVPALFDFIEDLTNWYIRLNRPRFWGEGMTDDKRAAYATLYTALDELGRVMAPFAPFVAEHIHRELTALTPAGQRGDRPESVHLCSYPQADATLIQPRLEAAVGTMQRAIVLGRQMREKARINLRMPLASLTVYHDDAAVRDELRVVERYLADELNVEAVQYGADARAVVALTAKANFRVLGKRLGKRMQEFKAAIEALDASALGAFLDSGSLELLGERFTLDEIAVEKVAKEGTEVATDGELTVELDTQLDDRLRRKGLAREFVNRIQKARKDLDFNVADRIAVEYAVPAALAAAIDEHRDYIAGEVLALELAAGAASGGVDAEIEGERVSFVLRRRAG
jgi:isoleucyl-tRNA synthetase